MTRDDFVLFSARLVELGELFDARFTESKLLLYFQALEDLPLEDVCQALVLAARGCTFFPKPAELRGFVSGDSEDQAERAWLEYKRVARVEGGYTSPVFEDAALAETLIVIFGSWEAACWTDFTPEMWSSKRKEFGRVYRVLRQRGETAPKQLTGFCARENAAKGLGSQSGHAALAEGEPTLEVER